MLFRVSGRGRPSAAMAGPRRRRRMAVARLGDAPRRGGRLLALPRLRFRALLLRSRRALARLRDRYADMVKGLVADAAAAEAPVKARRMAEAGTGGTVVAGAVLRCNSHYYIR
ncbi:hypothetical protein C2845_PM03G35290 [Panicum miliaceum]|uniref:Uncharacterized protein n=1 Tax=Panicum miliaceum TaxID=4540 RepID=A0A3L6TF71_PANMI|nr:hypothetical protein C2845_PM03G35290 [Panicum miliaceum]